MVEKEIEVRVSRELRRDDAARMRLVTHDPDVDRLLIEQHAHVGGLARRPALYRLALRERADRWRDSPVRLSETSVDVDSADSPAGNRNGCLCRAAIGLW